jgi:hypothetical protein
VSSDVRDVAVGAEVDAPSREREDWSEASIEDAEGASGSLRRRTVFDAAAAAFPAVLDPDAPIEPHPAPRRVKRARRWEGESVVKCFAKQFLPKSIHSTLDKLGEKTRHLEASHAWPDSRAVARALSTRERTGDEYLQCDARLSSVIRTDPPNPHASRGEPRASSRKNRRRRRRLDV